jgi:hypothetical protein
MKASAKKIGTAKQRVEREVFFRSQQKVNHPVCV